MAATLGFCASVPALGRRTVSVPSCPITPSFTAHSMLRKPRGVSHQHLAARMSVSPPPETSSEETSNDAGEPEVQKRVEDDVTARVRADLAADGINLDDLLDASSVLQLTREQDSLLSELEANPGDVAKEERLSVIRTELTKARRQVMQPFLKKVFLVQSVIFGLAGGVLSGDPDVPLVGQALGFWMVWLFTIPSLRARKGTARWEKSALNIAFVTTPLVNVLLPAFTKNCLLIWTADVTVLAACYAFFLTRAVSDVDLETDVEQAKIKGIMRYLDWGSWR